MGSDENKVVDYGAHNYNVTYNVPLLYSPVKIYQFNIILVRKQ